MEDKITIIEGPPPVFEAVGEAWAAGLNESRNLYDVVQTRLRTFNGPALVERCHRTWRQNEIMHLLYRNEMGLEEDAPILAARTIHTNDGDVLLLWVRLESQEEEETNEFDSGNEE
jgi:hypothetical protein